MVVKMHPTFGLRHQKTHHHGSSFEQMLYGAQVVCTPGVGFGLAGEGFIRLTSFGDRNDCIEAMRRIKEWLKA